MLLLLYSNVDKIYKTYIKNKIMELISINKLYSTIQEISTKGSLQEQAEQLCERESVCKNLLEGCNYRLEKTSSAILLNKITLMKNKYIIRLDYIKQEMCLLNRRIMETVNAIEDYVSWDIFIELFGLKEFDIECEDNEVNRNEDYYHNLIHSSTKVGHLVRTALIYVEGTVKDLYN